MNTLLQPFYLADICLSSKNFIYHSTSLRHTALALILTEKTAPVALLTRSIFELVMKQFTTLMGGYCETMKKLDHKIHPWTTIQLAGHVMIRLWLPPINRSINGTFPKSSLKKLNLSTTLPTPLPLNFVKELSTHNSLQILDLTQRTFDAEGFGIFLQKVKDHPTLKKISISKSLFTETQILDLQKLVSEKKGLKMIDSEGGRLGSVYMDWHEYNLEKEQAYQNGMRDTTLKAIHHYFLEHLDLPKRILDFGAGTGQDTIPLINVLDLLQIHAHIYAIDGDEEALSILNRNLSAKLKEHVTCVTSPFMEYQLDAPVDLLISSYTWPYRSPSDFPQCWEKCIESVKYHGYIAGQFFGPLSSCPADPGMTYHTEEEIKNLLEESGFEIKWFKKEDEDNDFEIFGGTGKPAWGKLYHIVAKKIHY